MSNFKKPIPTDSEPLEVEYTPEASGASPEEGLLDLDGVEGIGVGHDAAGRPAVNVYVRDEAVASRLPKAVGDKPVVPVVTGIITLD